MTVVVALLALAVALLCVLVTGLLRSHADILRRLHELDAAAAEPEVSAVPGLAAAGGGASRAFAGRAEDLVGRGPRDEATVLRVAGVAHDTLLLFLSSGCLTCRAFFEELHDPRGAQVPTGLRVVVVTRDAADEQPAALAELVAPLAAAGVQHLSSTVAWDAYAVPGSPYAVLVHGPSGAVAGEGTGADLEQVLRLLGQASGDVAFVSGSRKARGDAARERDTDRELLAAGILPGDPSLYPDASGSDGRNGGNGDGATAGPVS